MFLRAKILLPLLLLWLFIQFYDKTPITEKGLVPKSIQYYTVKEGDSLSMIADSYGYSYLDLAKWNQLEPPYQLVMGQRLKLGNDQIASNNPEPADEGMEQTEKNLPAQVTVTDNLLEPKVEEPAESDIETSNTEQEETKPVKKQTAKSKSSNDTIDTKAKETYTIAANDTLYSIGRHFGINPKLIAEWNHIDSPNQLLAGQKLSILKSAIKTQAIQPEKNENTVKTKAAALEQSNLEHNFTDQNVDMDTYIVQPGETLYSISVRFDIDYRQLATDNDLQSPDQLYAGRKLKIFKAKQKHSSEKAEKNELKTSKNLPTESHKKSIISINNENMLKFYWQWPVKGEVIKNFSQTDSRGIEISTNLGALVKAAAAGKVVAVASAPLGYGEFIVIAHDNSYLSSYANNRRSLVKQGQRVAQGQVIAEAGQIGRKQPSLKFEIRQNGKLVNPMLFLPKKK